MREDRRAYQSTPYEEMAKLKAEREICEKLKKITYTVDELLDIAGQNPKFGTLLEKSLVMAVAGFNQPENRDKIADWPDAVKSDRGVDAIASLNQRVQKEGVGALREFGGTKLSAFDVMLSVESVSFNFKIAREGEEDLQNVVLGPDWHEQVTNLLLQNWEESKE